MQARKIFTNRFSLTGIIIFLVVLIVRLYISSNDDGIVKGTVVDQQGRPVPKAKVEMRRKTLVQIFPPQTEYTNEKGEFIFKGCDFVQFLISASKEGYQSSEVRDVHLYFEKQNYTVAPSLKLVKK